MLEQIHLTFNICSSIMVSMKRLDNKQRIAVIAALVEGNSIRSTVRMTGVAKNTVIKLLSDVGMACADFQDKAFRNLSSKNIQCDEIWSFVGAKAKNVPDDRIGEFGIGDVWTWVAIDADTKLVPCWLVGTRDAISAQTFLLDLSERLAFRVQLTTDGYNQYLPAVRKAFGEDVDYARLVKIYGSGSPQKGTTRYSPAECIGCETHVVSGDPKQHRVSTSFVERQNLTMRMSMRRFTRLTNAFSKKVENHAHAVALHYMFYNFCRKHITLKGWSPAMASGLTTKLWTIADIIEMASPILDAVPAKRGPYKKRVKISD